MRRGSPKTGCKDMEWAAAVGNANYKAAPATTAAGMGSVDAVIAQLAAQGGAMDAQQVRRAALVAFAMI